MSIGLKQTKPIYGSGGIPRQIVIGNHKTFKKWCAANNRNPAAYINVTNEESARGYTAGLAVSKSLILLHDFKHNAVEVLETHGFTPKQPTEDAEPSGSAERKNASNKGNITRDHTRNQFIR